MAILIVNGKKSVSDTLDFHGSCVFTTLRSRNFELCLWQLHWQRLMSHASFFEYRLPQEGEIVSVLDDIIKTGSDQKIRVIIFADKFAIHCEPYSPPPSSIYDGVTTIISSMKVHPQLAKFKTGNSLPNALAHKEARKHGAFEALLCDTNGHVVDGSRTSLMMFDGDIMTILDGGLDGCMRAHVLTYLDSFNIRIDKKLVKPDEMSGQLLLLNSLLGVVPVGPARFPLISQLIDRFRMD